MKTISVNAKTAGHTEYTNYPFNSMVEFNGVYYGITAGGISQLSGATDNGTEIAAEALHVPITFATERRPDIGVLKKHIAGVYAYLRSAVEVRVLAVVDEEVRRSYELPQVHPAQGVHTRRAKFGRGLTGRTWQFGVENVAGGELEVIQLDVLPIVLSRRV